MAVKFSLTKIQPLLVDAHFIDQCMQIGNEVDAINREEIIKHSKITEEEFEYLLSGGNIDYDNERYRELNSAKSMIDHPNRDLSVHFDDGTVVESSEIDEIIDSIKYSSAKCEKIKMQFGGYKFYRFDMDIENKNWKTVTVYIKGESKIVNHLKTLSNSLINNSVPEHQYLRNSSFWALISILTWALLSSMMVFGIVTLLKKGIIDKAIGAGSIVATLIMIGFVTQPVVDFLKSPFPLVEFEFGSHSRRNRTSRSILNVATFAFFVPLLFTIISLLI